MTMAIQRLRRATCGGRSNTRSDDTQRGRTRRGDTQRSGTQSGQLARKAGR